MIRIKELKDFNKYVELALDLTNSEMRLYNSDNKLNNKAFLRLKFHINNMLILNKFMRDKR